MKQLSLIVMTALAVVLNACTDTVTDDPLAAAWQAFAEGRYQDAHNEFETFEPTEGTPAVIGLGWTTLKMDSLLQADRYFTMVSSDTSITDYAIWAYSGWAVTAWARNNLPAASTRAGFVLRNNPEFTLPFFGTVTKRTMWLLQAYGYLHSGNTASCLGRIQDLDPSFGNTTDPAALLTKLDALSKTEIGI